MQSAYSFIDFRNPEVLDAFGRLRVAEPVVSFESKLLGDNRPLLFDDVEVSGSGTGSSYDADASTVDLSVSNLTAGNRVRQSKQRGYYQPGRSLLMEVTFVLGSAATGTPRS